MLNNFNGNALSSAKAVLLTAKRNGLYCIADALKLIDDTLDTRHPVSTPTPVSKPIAHPSCPECGSSNFLKGAIMFEQPIKVDWCKKCGYSRMVK